MSDDVSKGGQTQAEIVNAAHSLFVKNGFHGTSMRQIARQAGIALGGIYNHFDSKEDIFVAVLEIYHPYHEILPALGAAHGDTVEAFVQDAANTLISVLDNQPGFLNLMLIEIVEFKSQHVPQLFERLYPEFISLMQKFIEKHDDLRQIPLAMIMRAFIGLFFSYYITEMLMSNRFPGELRDNALNYFVDIFLHGIIE